MTLVKNNEEKKKNGGIRLVKDVCGLSTVEYVIILALIAILSISLWKEFGGKLQDEISNASGEVAGLRN